MGVSAVCAAFYFIFMLDKGYRFEAKYKTYFRKGLKGATKLICIGLCCVMAIIAFNSVFSGFPLRSKVEATVNDQSQTIANCMDTLVLLENSRCQKLSEKEKIDVMQVIANIEQRYLGVPHELIVIASELEPETRGDYTNVSHIIRINRKYLNEGDPFDLVGTVAHEAYHAYEHSLVELYEQAPKGMKSLSIFRDAVIYMKEFSDYRDASDNYDEYYDQMCERDARHYADYSKKDYRDRIFAYLN